MKLSVIIITKNEEKDIEACLESIKWADEIIVLDSGSTDKTQSIVQKYTPHFYSTDWPGFGIQKQRALDKATGPWILSIDADERISTELKSEIQKSITANNQDGYMIPRLSYICGHPVKHCGWYPDYILRLFKKDLSQFTPALVHEKVECTGSIGQLNNHIIHYSYKTLHQFVDKINSYSSLGAKELHSRGKHSGVIKAFIRGLLAFFKIYFLKAGFLDGGVGLIVGISAFESAYYKYLKLHFIDKDGSP